MANLSRAIGLVAARAAALAAVLFMLSTDVSAAGRTAMRAADFVAAIGMNTKFKDLGSAYVDVDAAIGKLRYLGVTLIREGFPARELSESQLKGFHAFASAKGRFTFVTHNEKPVAEIVADIAAFERLHPGAVRAIEGPNELNNWPITYQGQKGPPAAKAYMADLYRAVKTDPTLGSAGVRVYGPTDWPPTAGMSDMATVHSYERNAYGSHERLRLDREAELTAYASAGVTPPGPNPHWVVTETGYHTWIGKDWFEGVDQSSQAQMGLALILDVAELGGLETQWYQLLDAWGPPHNSSEAFGVFDHFGAPKPLAVGLHNLILLLNDPGPTAQTFVPQGFDFVLSGHTGSQPNDGVYTLPLQTSDGTRLVAIWREGLIWDAADHKPAPLAPKMTRIAFPAAIAKLEVYDPLQSQAPVTTHLGASQIELTLSASPLILKWE